MLPIETSPHPPDIKETLEQQTSLKEMSIAPIFGTVTGWKRRAVGIIRVGAKAAAVPYFKHKED